MTAADYAILGVLVVVPVVIAWYTFPLPRPQHAELPWSFERCRRENLL